MQKRNTFKYKILVLFINMIFYSTVFAQIDTFDSSEYWNQQSNNKKSISLSFDNNSVNFNFNTYEDFANGIGGAGSDYSTEATIKTSKDWVIHFIATEPFWHENGGFSIPLDNVGITIKSPDYSRLVNYADTDAVPLSASSTKILQSRTRNERGNNNPNYSFTIFWEMGTDSPRMNKKSLLKQNLPKGQYRTTVEFVISEDL